ncbi:MAG: 16S rRNA processing protein RimM [Betaproteobacteria bacterium]|nr:MAG: 16S rRNA processing protein RimM [Betaproteobacteria bacterium]
MKIDACFQLGYVTGTHGLSGEVHVLLDTDQPENYKDLDSVFLLQKGVKTLVPFFIQRLKIKGDKAMVKFEEVSSKDQARKLTGSTLYLPLDHLPPLDGDNFYFHELVTWKVIDSKLGKLGSIVSVYYQTTQVLLVMGYQGHEVLIPYTREIVLGIDREHQLVQVSLPDGLLEVYLED